MSRLFDCQDEQSRAAGIAAAASAVRQGELVVFPTDTVYGLGADAFSPDAVRRLLSVKGRGRDLPVPVLIGSWRTVNGLVDVLPPTANDLIAAFWPGALTLVLTAGSGLTWDLGDTQGTVAVRMPLHPVALELLAETGPMAVSSANRSGSPPAVSAAAALQDLGDDVAVFLEGGVAPESAPSSIVDLTDVTPRLLRDGAVSRAELEDVLGAPLG
ncbi:MAG TPA: L-threonylcarbamoyladenylate synthase [Mycobacteriales bacterium]|nr:L-threonylcarbamoyladenylate synthase [Mycobacteriales bacterium]